MLLNDMREAEKMMDIMTGAKGARYASAADDMFSVAREPRGMYLHP